MCPPHEDNLFIVDSVVMMFFHFVDTIFSVWNVFLIRVNSPLSVGLRLAEWNSEINDRYN